MLKPIPGTRIFPLIMVALAVAGCSRPIESMSDAELAKKYNECFSMNAPAPAAIMACDNYKRECERRRRELNNFSC